MTFTAKEVCDSIPQLLINCADNAQSFDHISSIEAFDAQSLIFISELEQSDTLEDQLPSVVVTNETVQQALNERYPTLCIITVNNVRLAQALIKSTFNDYDAKDQEWPSIHPSAVIHESAKLGDNVRIGPNVVIGENTQIGNNTIVRANCVIERNVVIGKDCIIHSLVNVNQACLLGDRVILRPGVIIGNEGFGFAQDDQGRYHRIPHTGIVRIEDDVQIGSHGNIDRATYGETVIKRGVKMDSFCHVAHNVIVGEDTLFVSQCGIAGSSKIGKNVILSGQTGVLDHRTIVDNAVLVHRCGVTEDITAPGLWAGTPPKPMKEYVRNLNPVDKMKRMEKKLNEKIKALEEKLALLDQGSSE